MAKANRSSNFELLRIVAMLMIVVFHSVIDLVNKPNGDYLVGHTELIGAMRFVMDFFGNTGVVLFAMISGYFLIKSSNNEFIFKRAGRAGLKFAGMIFYNGFIVTGATALLLAILQKVDIVHLNFISDNIFQDGNTFFGFAGGYWYLSAYFILLVLSSPINRFLNSIQNSKNFLYAIVIVVFTTTIINYVPVLSVRDGVNFPLVFVGYMLGSYVRLFDPLKNVRTRVIWLLIFAFPVYFYTTYEFLVRVLHVAERSANPGVGYYVAFPVYVLAMLIFTLFSRMHFSNRFINTIAPATVFVYIFHTAMPYALFFRGAGCLYSTFIVSLNLPFHVVDLALILVIIMYSLSIMAIATVLYFIYEFVMFRISSWWNLQVDD
ncbi:hypothetical protein EFL45_07575 [Weissella confusa]|uniref:acyltransferase family protein n=1 Tax=Weissella confusa TaxID=1583 RepID=UPI00223A9ED0|nr:acyltransferase [Weissella confusa]MCT0949268.1 hypothetical protein [Weissella confusa]